MCVGEAHCLAEAKNLEARYCKAFMNQFNQIQIGNLGLARIGRWKNLVSTDRWLRKCWPTIPAHQ